VVNCVNISTAKNWCY